MDGGEPEVGIAERGERGLDAIEAEQHAAGRAGDEGFELGVRASPWLSG